MRGRVEQAAQVTADAVADKVCVVGWSTVRHRPCASSEGIVKALRNVLQSVRNVVASRKWSDTKDLVVNHDVVSWSSMPLDG